MDCSVLTFIALVFLSLPCNVECYSSYKYKAAVYEHALIPPDRIRIASRDQALADVMVNLKIYDQQAKKAALEDVDILVFPENGLYGYTFTRASIKPYLEEIPDPVKELSNPCNQPQRYANTEIQVYLSCMAMKYSMYIVANMGSKKPCTRKEDPCTRQEGSKCPSDGQFQFNTNVVYAPSGRLIARYHKQNLYYENQFNVPNDVNYATFETPFGKFGVFTCFDILYKEPAITLIEKFDVTNIVYPTAWMDALPLLSSIQFHSAFAEGMGVNFLAANLHLPSVRAHGSGIYTPNGPKDFYYSEEKGVGKLVISQLDIIRHRKKQQTPYNKVPEPISTQTFSATVFKDTYTLVELKTNSGSVSVCHNKLCCHLDYSIQGNNELYAFGAFDGIHKKDPYYLQICTLLKCANQTRQSCGKWTKQASNKFTEIRMYGTFETNYVFPEVLEIRDGLLSLRSPGWSYNNGVLQTTTQTMYPVVSATLFGRWYSKDQRRRSLFQCGRDQWRKQAS